MTPINLNKLKLVGHRNPLGYRQLTDDLWFVTQSRKSYLRLRETVFRIPGKSKEEVQTEIGPVDERLRVQGSEVVLA